MISGGFTEHRRRKRTGEGN